MSRREGRSFIGALDVGAEMLKILYHAVVDHGGSETVLEDAIRKDPDLVADIAKAIVGRIWDLAETATEVEVNWAQDPLDIRGEFELAFANYMFAEDMRISPADTSSEVSHHRYTLAHETQIVEGVWERPEIFCVTNRGATYRELVAYAANVHIPVGPYIIVAPGTLLTGVNHSYYVVFKHEQPGKRIIELIDTSYFSEGNGTFPSHHFYLMRAKETSDDTN